MDVARDVATWLGVT